MSKMVNYLATHLGVILFLAISICCYASTGLDEGKKQILFSLKGGYAGSISDFELSVTESATGNKISVTNGVFHYLAKSDVLRYIKYNQESKIVFQDQVLATIFKKESQSILKIEDVLATDKGDDAYNLVSSPGSPEIILKIGDTTGLRQPASGEASTPPKRKDVNFWGLTRLLDGGERMIFDNCLECTSVGCAPVSVSSDVPCLISAKNITSKDGTKKTTIITELNSGTALAYFSAGQIYLVTDEADLAKGAMLGDSPRMVQSWKRNQCRAVEVGAYMGFSVERIGIQG